MSYNKSKDYKEEDIINVKIKLNRILFPHDGLYESGAWVLALVCITEVIKSSENLTMGQEIKIVGKLPIFEPNEEYSLIAAKEIDKKYGKQYNVLNCCKILDTSNPESSRLFLSKICTELQLKHLYNTYDNPIEFFETKNIEALSKVQGIGETTAKLLLTKYENNKDLADYYVKMSKYDLTPNILSKLLNHYNSPDTVIQIMETNPYKLIDIDGIGFKKADEIALNTGVISEQSPERIKAFIIYLLTTKAEEGDSYYYLDELVDELDFSLGEIETDILLNILHELEDNKTIWVSENRKAIGLMEYYNLEQNIAKEIFRLLNAKNKFKFDNWEKKIESLEKEQGWEFTEEQILGIKTILENQVVIIVGDAGTGKTSSVVGMLEVIGDKYEFSQTALSGRASCNMSDVTGMEGFTIHRLLGFNPLEGFMYDKENKLPVDGVILDEGSMVGLDIFYKLVQAIETGSKLIILGDEGQLESIGAGNLLFDMIESGIVPTVRLTKIHRQAQKSAIITEGRKIKRGEQITEKGFIGNEIRGDLQDLELDIYKDKLETQSRIIKHYKELLNKGINYTNIQVIVPLKERGEACSYKINSIIQKIIIDTEKEKKKLVINPNAKNSTTIYVGDKVMNTINNYQAKNLLGKTIGIFNGDIGIVTDINIYKREVIVNFLTKGKIVIDSESLFGIELAYACTTHKLQGSSSPYVICGIDYSHYMLLCKQMLYTMLTRTKKYCVLCAESKALRYAISTDKVVDKQTFLSGFLKGTLPIDNKIKENEKKVVNL
ncbi:MAG: AAA family ATPase [Clostridium sp.]